LAVGEPSLQRWATLGRNDHVRWYSDRNACHDFVCNGFLLHLPWMDCLDWNRGVFVLRTNSGRIFPGYFGKILRMN